MNGLSSWSFAGIGRRVQQRGGPGQGQLRSTRSTGKHQSGSQRPWAGVWVQLSGNLIRLLWNQSCAEMFSSEPNGQTYTTFSSSYRPWTPPSPTKIMSWNSAHKFLIQGVKFDDISSSTICSSWVLKCVLWASWYMSDSYPQDKTFLTITKRGDTLNLESCSESEVCFGQLLQKQISVKLIFIAHFLQKVPLFCIIPCV